MTWFVINAHLCGNRIVQLLICAKLFYCVSPDPCGRGLGMRRHCPLISYVRVCLVVDI